MDFDAAGADEVFKNFVQQNEVRIVAKEFQDVVAAGGDAGLVVLANEFVTGFASERPGDPAPKRVRLALAIGKILAVGWD